jgi:hypothetical protein
VEAENGCSGVFAAARNGVQIDEGREVRQEENFFLAAVNSL